MYRLADTHRWQSDLPRITLHTGLLQLAGHYVRVFDSSASASTFVDFPFKERALLLTATSLNKLMPCCHRA